ncbi:MAG: Rpn family recombination-promoting nuclease/putative transposase [Chitinivibrionales bacterium]
MQHPIPNPHDRFFKESLGRKQIARSFIREYLPISISSRMDLRTLEIVKDTHIKIKR